MSQVCLFVAAVLLQTLCLAAQTGTLPADAEKRADLRIPELDRSALEPETRALAPAGVAPGERNPFGLLYLPPPKETEVKVEEETEEDKIKRVILAMPVSGLSSVPGVPDSFRVMLGPMALSKGEVVPKMFHDQTEKLVVKNITDGKIEFAFVEAGESELPPREFGRAFERGLSTKHEDGSPRVGMMMAGEIFADLVKFQGSKVAEESQSVSWAAARAILKSYENELRRGAFYGARRRFIGDMWPSSSGYRGSRIFDLTNIPANATGEESEKNESGASK
jgi:hypothetical protein